MVFLRFAVLGARLPSFDRVSQLASWEDVRVIMGLHYALLIED